MAAFRDELVALFPNDPRAHSLNHRVVMLSEYLVEKDFRPPPLKRKAVAHAHCHHHAVIGLSAERAILSRLGLDFKLLDAGCCGMAGSFGFEAKEYDLSIRIAEHQLLPAIRNTVPETLIIADGYRCREQISQLSDRHPVHLAEVSQIALQGGRSLGHGSGVSTEKTA